MKKEVRQIYEHILDERVNVLYCANCHSKPHVGDGLCRYKTSLEDYLKKHPLTPTKTDTNTDTKTDKQ